MNKNFQNSITSILICSGLTFFGGVAHASETVEGAKKDIASFKAEMNTKLDDLNKEIEQVRAKAHEHGKKVTERTSDELEKSRAELQAQVADLEKRSNSSIKKAKADIGDSIDRLNAKIQDALKN